MNALDRRSPVSTPNTKTTAVRAPTDSAFSFKDSDRLEKPADLSTQSKKMVNSLIKFEKKLIHWV